MIVSGHNNSCWGTNVSGHKSNVSGHKSNVYGHKSNVYEHKSNVYGGTNPMCLGTIISGHKCVWAQTCLGKFLIPFLNNYTILKIIVALYLGMRGGGGICADQHTLLIMNIFSCSGIMDIILYI